MPVDVTDNYVRVDVKAPGDFQKGTLRTMDLDVARGIKAIIERPKGKNLSDVQAYLFESEKDWNEKKAEAWVKKNKAKHETKKWKVRADGYPGDPGYAVAYKKDGVFMMSALSEEEQYLAQEAGNIVLNRSGLNRAKALIRAGDYTSDAAWGFSAADGNKILGKSPRDATTADWTRFGSWHLGLNRSGSENSKDRYRFPFGKGGKVYRRALAAIAQRASQFGYERIGNEASALIDMIRAQEEKATAKDKKKAMKCEKPGHMKKGEKMKAKDEDLELVLIYFEEFAAVDEVPDGPGDHVELDDDGVPTAFRIREWGAWSTTKYPTIMVDQKSAKDVIRWYKARGIRCVIDWEHQTYKTAENGKPAPALGWFDIEVRDDGIWASNVEWTDEGRELLKEKKYRYFSPTGRFDRKTGKLATIETIGLTNIPATNKQLPLVASHDPNMTGGQDMDQVLETLGLKPEATEEEAVEAIKEIQTKVDEAEKKDEQIADLQAKLDEAGKDEKEFKSKTLELCELKEDAGLDDVKAYVATMKATAPDQAELGKLKKENEELSAKVEDNRISSLLTEFDAKVTPANKGTVEDLARTLEEDKFRTMIANWPDVKGEPGTTPAPDKAIEERNRPPETNDLSDDEEKILKARADSNGWNDEKVEEERKKLRDAKKRIAARAE